MSETLGIDVHNIISTDEAIEILTTMMKRVKTDRYASKKIPAVLLRGAPGVGKSTIVKSVADSLGVGFVDIRLAQMERVDIAGLPSVEDGVTKWNVPAIWPRDPDSKGIIFLDELTAAPADVQVAAYQIILDRGISNSNYKIPDGWLIVGAGNRTTDRSVAKTMSAALANRMSHFEVDANPEDWGRWAVSHDIHPSVTGFIGYRPSLLFKMEKQNLEMGWPSPRSWERVSDIISMFSYNEDILRKNVYALIGNQVGVEFMEFHKLNKNFDNVLMYLTDPDAEITIPERADERYAIASAISYLLWNGTTENDDKIRVEGMFRVIDKMSSDFATMIVKLALLGNSRVSKLAAMKYVAGAKGYKDFIEKHGKSLKKDSKFSLELPKAA